MTPERVDLFLQKLASMAVLVNDVPSSGIPLRDSAERPYLDLALSTEASYLVSRDNDLLDLMNDEVTKNQSKGLAIAHPAKFIAIANK
ncbi:MAG: hypothetical protein ACJ8C4_06570 [Gemmataceae bacterium]